ncbi:MAG TPA: riboflavin synthase [Vicinamibacterales bacterium]|jgi:riboflavin synthase
MFTGLIEATGTVASISPRGAGLRLAVATDLAPELSNGESLAVNGVCLTVIADRGGVEADISPETARVTTLGGLRAGTVINLERSMRADARIGGHFVQGHVDGTGTIDALRQEGDAWRVTVAFPPELSRYLVVKGSIAVDGISLTIASIDASGNRFDVQIIPFTWGHTNLQHARIGDRVNLECDILGKYVARAVEQRGV